MKIGFVGLGKMGANMVERLIGRGHEVAAFDLNGEARDAVREKGALVFDSLEGLVGELPVPRTVWIMVPAGYPTEQSIIQSGDLLERGDIVIDGGNSNYRDSMRHARNLEEKGIHFLDVGTSGGVWGREIGYCLMVGGDKPIFHRLEPVFRDLAPDGGYALVGKNGAGHFVKMVHNGIEYGLLEAYAEGFEILEGKKEFALDLHGIARLWNQGSVVRSWLLDLAERALSEDPGLEGIKGYVSDSGEGRWTVEEALELDIPAPVITMSLLQRFRSRQTDSFGAKMIAALRNQFGGHPIREKE